MVTVAIRALDLEYLVKIYTVVGVGSRYIFTDSDTFLPTPTSTPQPWVVHIVTTGLYRSETDLTEAAFVKRSKLSCIDTDIST
jgi:hypothetical protein